MSCFPELTYSVYLDGELSSDQQRPVESHLVQCRRCRELVMALREESQLLGDTLQGRALQPLYGRAGSPAPVEALAWGMGPTVLALAGLLVALGWFLDTALPAPLDLMGTLSLKGVYDMGFRLVFLVRDQAPALFEVGLAVAAMASASALLTFALSVLRRRWSGPGLLTLGLVLALVAPASESRAHFGLHEHEDYELPAGQVHDGTLLASGKDVNLDGVVTGDVFAFAERLTVRGEVKGNIIVFARNVEIPGKVTGSVHVAAGITLLTGQVEGNLYALSEQLTLAEGSRVGQDVAFAGEKAVAEGRVGRDLLAWGERVEVRGEIGRNVRARTERLALLDGARVGSDVEVQLPPGREVEQSAGARVAGEVRSSPWKQEHGRGLKRFLEAHFYLWIVLHLAAAFIVGMVLHALAPALFANRLEDSGAFFRNLGLGVLVVLTAPVAVLVVALTLVGIPLAAMGLALFLAALYVAGILVAHLIGEALVPSHADRSSFGLTLLVGLLILTVVTQTPFLGGPLEIVALLSGMGLLAERARSAWVRQRTAPA